MVASLNLDQRPGRARHEEDGHAEVEVGGRSVRLLFECKSAPVGGDFGTGRDTGMRQLQRWETMHFAFGWFEPRDTRPTRLWYGSPAMMRPWNQGEQAYLGPDLALLDLVPEAVDQRVVAAVLDDKDVYTYQDMRRLLKDQWNADRATGRPNRYQLNADVWRGRRSTEHLYSRTMAERAVRDRVRYLLARGGTVNNRKISAGYVLQNCHELKPPRFADELARAVQNALMVESPAETLGE